MKNQIEKITPEQLRWSIQLHDVESYARKYMGAYAMTHCDNSTSEERNKIEEQIHNKYFPKYINKFDPESKTSIPHVSELSFYGWSKLYSGGQTSGYISPDMKTIIATFDGWGGILGVTIITK